MRLNPVGVAVGSIVAALAVVLGLTALSAQSEPYSLSPAQLIGPAAPVGDRVIVGGRVKAMDGVRAVMLVPEDASGPTVTVVLGSDAPPSRWESGAFGLFRGTLVRPGVIGGAHSLRRDRASRSD